MGIHFTGGESAGPAKSVGALATIKKANESPSAMVGIHFTGGESAGAAKPVGGLATIKKANESPPAIVGIISPEVNPPEPRRA